MASLYKKSIDKLDNTNKPTRYYSSKQEKAVAKATGSKVVVNSGATMWKKGDVSNDDLSILIECKTKTSDSKSFTIKKEWLDKNLQESIFMGKDYSILAFNFGPNKQNYYVLDELTFQEFLKYLEKRKE